MGCCRYSLHERANAFTRYAMKHARVLWVLSHPFVVESEQWNEKLLWLRGGFFDPRSFERADHAFVIPLMTRVLV